MNDNNELSLAIQETAKKLAKNLAERPVVLAEEVVDKVTGEVMDISQQVLEALADEKTTQKDIILMLAKEVVRAANGRFNVQDFHERDKSEQEVYVYVGTHWELFNTQLFHDKLKQMVISMGVPEKYFTDDKFMTRFYTRMLFMLKNKHSELQFRSKTFINLMNGTLVINEDGTPELIAHDPKHFIRYVLPYCYDPQAQCPMFEQYLSQVLPDEDVRKVVQEFIGYCFTRNLRLEKILMLCGKGSNGKSVLIDVTTELFGKCNVSNVMLSDFDDGQKLATMDGKMANMSSETGRKFHPETVKTLASGEPVTVKVVYKQPFRMTNYGKLITSFNKLPSPEDTWAFFRRLLKIDFKIIINSKEQDKNLARKICDSELSGVLNWALEGLQRLVVNGDFTDSQEITDSIEQYKNQADTVLLFASSCCDKDDDAETKGKAILDQYRIFCAQEELPKWRILGRQKFYERLSELYTVVKHSNVPYFGLNLKDYE